jgi:hypothetical protein
VTEPDPRVWHVYPLHEAGHDLTGYGDRCWCRPRVERRDPATGIVHMTPLVIHRDAAQRAAESA